MFGKHETVGKFERKKPKNRPHVRKQRVRKKR